MKKLSLLLLLLLLILPFSTAFPQGMQPVGGITVAGGGAPANQWYLSTFTGSEGTLLTNHADWTLEYTSAGTDRGEISAANTAEYEYAAAGDKFKEYNYRYDGGVAGSVDQSGQFTVVSVHSTEPLGIAMLFRQPPTSTGDGYIISLNCETTGATSWAKSVNWAWSANIQTDQTLTCTSGDVIGMAVKGVGHSTNVYIWNPPDSTNAWDGTVGAGSNWGAPDVTMSDNPGANAVDSGTSLGMRFYTGNGAQIQTFDTWRIGDVAD